MLDDIVIHNAPLYKELDSGYFAISGGGFVLPRDYITQKVVFSLKEEQRNVKTKAFFSGKENTFEIISAERTIKNPFYWVLAVIIIVTGVLISVLIVLIWFIMQKRKK